jgi:hypothetical protein
MFGQRSAQARPRCRAHHAAPGGRAAAAGRAAARAKRVLAWADTRNGQAQHESVGHALAVIEKARLRVGPVGHVHPHRLEHHFRRAKEDRRLGCERWANLSNVDAIFFMGHREVPLEPSQREELLKFVREGKGFVAAHVGLTAFESWPEFLDLLGARFDGHPSRPGSIVNERPDFPATKHFPASFLQRRVLSAKEHRARRSTCCSGSISPTCRPATASLKGDYPLAWAKTTARAACSRVVRALVGNWDVRNIQQCTSKRCAGRSGSATLS